jgi:hypothetical protein
MTSKKDLIKSKLEEYGIEVYKDFQFKDEDIIMSENMTISCKNNDLFINFHVVTKPSHSARIILILKDIKGIENFTVGNDYLFDETGKFIDGEEAYKYHEDILKKTTISKFMDEQSQLYYLNNAKPYHC